MTIRLRGYTDSNIEATLKQNIGVINKAFRK